MILENRRLLQAILTRMTPISSEQLDKLNELTLPASMPEELEALNQSLKSGAVGKKLVRIILKKLN